VPGTNMCRTGDHTPAKSTPSEAPSTVYMTARSTLEEGGSASPPTMLDPSKSCGTPGNVGRTPQRSANGGWALDDTTPEGDTNNNNLRGHQPVLATSGIDLLPHRTRPDEEKSPGKESNLVCFRSMHGDRFSSSVIDTEDSIAQSAAHLVRLPVQKCEHNPEDSRGSVSVHTGTVCASAEDSRKAGGVHLTLQFS
jgi:hypothetical protein